MVITLKLTINGHVLLANWLHITEFRIQECNKHQLGDNDLIHPRVMQSHMEGLNNEIGFSIMLVIRVFHNKTTFKLMYINVS